MNSLRFKKFSAAIFATTCLFSVSACSEIDFTSVPGYKTLFGKEQEVSKIKRRPIENIATANAPQLVDPRVAIERKIAGQNMYGAPNSVPQTFDDPKVLGNTKVVRPDFTNRELYNTVGKPDPDFRSEFEPINPMRREERSAYDGRVVNQEPVYPGQKNAGQFWPQANDPSAPNVMNPQLPNYAYNTVVVAGQYGTPQVQAGMQLGMPQQVTDINAPRQPSLNEKIKMELLAGTTAVQQNKDFPNLSSVPQRQDYNELKTEMNSRMERLMQERIRTDELRQRVESEQPIELIGPNGVDPNFVQPPANNPASVTQQTPQRQQPVIERTVTTEKPVVMPMPPESPLNNYEINNPAIPQQKSSLSKDDVAKMAEMQFNRTPAPAKTEEPASQPEEEMAFGLPANKPLREKAEKQVAANDVTLPTVAPASEPAEEKVLPLPAEEELKPVPVNPDIATAVEELNKEVVQPEVTPEPIIEEPVTPEPVKQKPIKLKKPSVYLERAKQTPESFKYKDIQPKESVIEEPVNTPVLPPVSSEVQVPQIPEAPRAPLSFKYKDIEPRELPPTISEEKPVSQQRIKLRPPKVAPAVPETPLSMQQPSFKPNEVVPPMSIERPEFVETPPVATAPEKIQLRPPVIDSPEPAAVPLNQPKIESDGLRVLPESRYNRRRQ